MSDGNQENGQPANVELVQVVGTRISRNEAGEPVEIEVTRVMQQKPSTDGDSLGATPSPRGHQ